MIAAILPSRPSDRWGEGHFGASRGDRKHNGHDFACYPGSKILSPVSGKVTKIGYPYGDDLNYRYVQITDILGSRVRLFYVYPAVCEGDEVNARDYIGNSQHLGKRYEGITEHVHVEVISDGEYVDPVEYLE